MHIAFFNRSFYPEIAATGQLLTELCESLVADHDCRVSVVAAGNGAQVRRGVVARERHGAIEVLRARGTQLSKRRVAGRFTNYMTYFLSACYSGLRLDRPDVVVALTDPPIIGLAAYLAAQRFGARLVISYQDVFPEAARAMEHFHSPTVEQVLGQVNRFLVRKADRLVVLGATMRQRLIEGKGADPERVVIIPYWADCSLITPGPKQNPFSLAHGLADKFVVMHSGNIGLAQGLEIIVSAAARLQAYPEIQLVLVGDGVKKSAIEREVRARGLSNVCFLPYQPKEHLPDSFASADVFLVSLKRGLAGYIVPSKVYGILAAGRPYVAAVEVDCEVAAIAQQYDCGLLAEPENPDDLADKILVLYRDRALRERLAANARQAALQFDRRRQVQAYYDLFWDLTQGRRQFTAGVANTYPGGGDTRR